MVTVNSFWVKFFHIIYMFVWLIMDMNPGQENFKYFFWIMPIGFSFLIFHANGYKVRKETFIFWQQLLYNVFFLFVALVALIINEYYILDLRDILRNMFVIAYAFLLLNTDSTENKDFYVDSIFIACILDTIIRYSSRFTIANILSINFFDSYSPFELHLAHEYAFIFIYYYRRRKFKHAILAVIMSYLTLKRIHILFVIAICILGPFIKDIRVSNLMINVGKLGFMLSPTIMTFFISPGFVNWFESTFDVSFRIFTMTRFEQMVTISSYEGSLLGPQAVEQFLIRINYGVTCHSDLFRIYFETTIIGLALYVNSFFNMLKVNRNIFSLLATLLLFLSMFASLNLNRSHTYLILYFLYCVDFDAATREDELNKARRLKSITYSGFSFKLNRFDKVK
jgi:hypothetical protein